MSFLKSAGAILIFFCAGLVATAQPGIDSITEQKVRQAIEVLASDSLRGRGNGSPDLLKAATFIGEHYQQAGLQPFPGELNYFIPFAVAKNSNNENILAWNVVGILPGRSKPDEAVIFTAHYDHVGVIKSVRKDSIMNGANDNASGTTAVLMLAEYFAKQNNNERTLVFCAFAGEELGLIGSRWFAGLMAPEKITAVINIEMIGVPQFGVGSVFITGENYSSLPGLLKEGLKAAGIKVRREPNKTKMLFQRSDNYPFALEGVPAHTIMSSDDDDKCYHSVCDELERINIPHMVKVIRGIAIAAATLADGTATPTRIKPGKVH